MMKQFSSTILFFVLLFLAAARPAVSQTSNVKSAREVISMLSKGQYKEIISIFDSTMKKAAPEQRLRAIWTSLIGQTGKLQKELGDTTIHYNGYDIVIVTCEFEKSETDIKVVFDKDGEIAGFFFTPHHEAPSHPESGDGNLSGRSVSSDSVAGSWEGKLKTRMSALRIVMKFTVEKDGKLTAVLDSPDQGVTGIRVDTVTLRGEDVRVVLNAAHAVYRGEVKADSDMIVGEWTQGGVTLPLILKRAHEPVEKTESEIPPATYISRDITFENKKANVTLAGTLTIPDSTGTFPAVLLITGSGPHDRDETIFGHKPFLVLADYLTRHGISVLRYDKRGIDKSTGDYAEATTMDFTSDALAGVNYLMTLKQINHKEIGLIGHSEGGEIAPIVADQSPNVAFIVLMAGPGIPGYRIILSQMALIDKAAGVSDSTINTALGLVKQLLDIVMAEKDSVKAADKLKHILETGNAETAAAADASISQLLSPWYRTFLSYDPGPALRKVKCPVLAIWGSKDLQVPPAENLPAVENALKRGGNKNFKIVEMPGLNHLFQDAQTGSPLEYGRIRETISPKALEVITKWILRVAGKKH